MSSSKNTNRYDEIMQKARLKNKRFDAVDHKNGYPTPNECGARELLATAMSAIKCGLSVGDWNAVAEGQAMLEDLEKVILLKIIDDLEKIKECIHLKGDV